MQSTDIPNSAIVANMILLVCLISYCMVGMVSDRSPRIVGGNRVEHRENFAYQVSLRKSGSHCCGGSLIDTRHVLSAAHCVYDKKTKELLPANYFSVAAGNLLLAKDPDEVVIKVERIFVHEDYNASADFHDLVLLRLSSNFSASNPKIQPILLNSVHVDSGTCTVSGWGTVQYGNRAYNDDLLFVDVPIVSWDNCRMKYGNNLSQEMICAGETGKDSCQGDSGGPLKCGDKLTGIVSFGKECGKPGFPGVYIEVFSYLNWIEKHRSLPFSSHYFGLFYNDLCFTIFFITSIYVVIIRLMYKLL